MKIDPRRTVRLNPDNTRRIRALTDKYPVFSVNKIANIVLTLSLHLYERNSEKLFRRGK
jgi:hypothetical protein